MRERETTSSSVSRLDGEKLPQIDERAGIEAISGLAPEWDYW